MTITTFDNPRQAAQAVQDLLMDPEASKDLPEAVRDRLRDLVRVGASPVVAIAQGAEILYAHRSSLGHPPLELGAALAEMGTRYFLHGLADDRRGVLLQQTMLKKAGKRAPEGQKWPTKEEEPEALPQYADKGE